MRTAVLGVGPNSAHLRVIDAYPGAPPLLVHRYKSPTHLAEATEKVKRPLRRRRTRHR
jgi:exopolyphosphatase/guanosine-5'-triphosphate,3'-diphosphate pyrophosphatase